MGRKAVQGQVGVQDQPRFLLAEYQPEGVRVYRGTIDGEQVDLVLQSRLPAVIDEAWPDQPDFIRDLQAGVVKTSRTDTVPPTSLPDIDPAKARGLRENQVEIARMIARTPELTEQLRQIVRIHEVLGDTPDMPPQNVKVTKRYVQTEHLVFLRATLDLERRYRARPEIVELLTSTIRECEAL